MSASPKTPGASNPGLLKRPSGSRPAAPLFEAAAQPAPVARPSGPRPVPPGLRPSGPRAVPGQAQAPRPLAPVRVAPRPPPRKKRRGTAWPFYLAMGLILLALPAGYFALLEEGAVTSSPELATPGKPVELTLAQVDGPVEIRRGNGQWTQARAGEPLQASDAVRTGPGGKAILSGGDEYEVRLEAQTEVAVDELTDSISRVMLGGGMATAQVQGGGKHTFEVHARNSDAVARTRQGTFEISNNMAGTVAVGTREGEVEFAGQGKTVIVRSGQRSVVRPGQAPSDPTVIPTSLLRRVDWPADRTLTRRDVVISGEAEPGAVVMVQGRPARVSSTGVFTARATLGEGRTDVHVVASYPGAPREEEQREVRVDTKAPKVTLEDDIWKK